MILVIVSEILLKWKFVHATLVEQLQYIEMSTQ